MQTVANIVLFSPHASQLVLKLLHERLMYFVLDLFIVKAKMHIHLFKVEMYGHSSHIFKCLQAGIHSFYQVQNLQVNLNRVTFILSKINNVES